MRRMAVIGMAVACLAPAAAAAKTPTQIDRRAEAASWGVSRSHVRVSCERGRRGNYGCDYYACVNLGDWSGLTATASVSMSLGWVWVRAHDAVVRRHGRWVVLEAIHARIMDGCRTTA